MSSEISVRGLGAGLVTVAFLGAVIGGVGAPLITSVALDTGVPLDAAQWTLTVTLFTGAISAPVLGRLGTGPGRRATVTVTLGLVALGGLITAIPLPFGGLLLGRGLQGLGLGVVALLMSVARDHLPVERAQSTIATISVAGTVGIGVAYPLMGLIDQLAGLRVAYGVGSLLSLIAVSIAWRVVPHNEPHASSPEGVDVPGALLLAIGTLGILLVVAQPAVWGAPWAAGTIVVVSALSLVGWVLVERRTQAPLVDVRILAANSVARANVAMLTAGIGMYLLFSLLARYVQTPDGAGYGFGLSGVLAGAALLPFSVFGFAAGRLSRLSVRLSARWVFVGYVVAVVVGALLFTRTAESLIAVLFAMAVLGFGVGGASAVMPRLVLDGVPIRETASVLSVNQIVRTVGFSIGSALAGLILAGSTADEAVFPDEIGYARAAIGVVPFLAISVLVMLVRRPRTSSPA